MIFTNKPNKADSIKLKDKRRISWLNTDFKLLTGLENARHGKILDHTVCENQFALGTNKNISHAIALARDAIWAASKKTDRCAIADLDFMSAFNFLCMEWVYAVLEKKGMRIEAIQRIRRYYDNSVTIPIVNRIPGRPIVNKRLTLRQDDCPSTVWF